MNRASITAPDTLSAYRAMVLIRVFETRVSELVLGTHAGRFTHLSCGQEAVAVGVCSALSETDRLALTYRHHAFTLARGADPRRLMAEILGRVDGYCGGRAGSMHSIVPEIGIIDVTAIVSANIPIGTGSALASWIRADDAVTVCVFGDGAVAEGGFHEALNMAALWRLPIVYVCENNGYAMSTPFAATSPVTSVAQRAAAYGMPAITVDGNDLQAVWTATHEAVCRAAAGTGPTLIECRTQLLNGHYVGTPPQASSPVDPIDIVRADITDKEAEEVEQAVAAVVEEAVRLALESPVPTQESLLSGALMAAED